MIKNLFVLLLIGTSLQAISQDCIISQAYDVLDINNVKANLRADGSLWRGEGKDGQYIFPNNGVPTNEVSAIYAGGLWVGAYDNAGNLKVAAQKYANENNTDYWPGPLNEEGETNAQNCANWDRLFKVNSSKVDDHKQDFAEDGDIDLKREQIYSWPARGNQYFEEYNGFELTPETELAPFQDRNANGIYEPNLGEYPLIKGNQSVWWVFNDSGNKHFETGADRLNVEVQAMAYAYKSELTSFDNSTFYEFKILNRGIDDLVDFRVGLWVDPDLGCYLDDNFGYDTISHSAFIYNEDALDGVEGTSCPGGANTYADEIPIVGITIIESSFEHIENSNFIYTSGLGSPTGPPNDARSTYNILNGLWADGLPLTSGGNGYNPGSTDSVRYALTELPISPCSTNLNFPTQFILSTGGFKLEPGASANITYLVVAEENVPYPCPNIDPIRKAIEEIKGDIVLSEKNLDLSAAANFTTFPNPNNGQFTINFEQSFSGGVQLLDIAGRVLLQQNIESTQEISINESLATGLYIIKATDNTGRTSSQKMVINQ